MTLRRDGQSKWLSNKLFKRPFVWSSSIPNRAIIDTGICQENSHSCTIICAFTITLTKEFLAPHCTFQLWQLSLFSKFPQHTRTIPNIIEATRRITRVSLLLKRYKYYDCRSISFNSIHKTQLLHVSLISSRINGSLHVLRALLLWNRTCPEWSLALEAGS